LRRGVPGVAGAQNGEEETRQREPGDVGATSGAVRDGSSSGHSRNLLRIERWDR
jgi:hypothetical protein